MSSKIKHHEIWMRIALEQAKKSIVEGEVPVGAILVHQNKIISMAHNSSISEIDPTSHAEINVIRKATKVFGNHRMPESELYCTLEPCAMCYGAMANSRIKKIIFGAYDPNTGVCGTCIDLSLTKCFNHRPIIIGGILEKECSGVLKDFFKSKRYLD